MTDAELRERCAYWQRILRLQDWRVDVRLADSAETDGQLGNCHVFQDAKLAIIRILRAETRDLTDIYSQAFPESDDPEFTLIHELLHIPFDSILNDEAERHEKIMQEQALDFVAGALFELSRKK